MYEKEGREYKMCQELFANYIKLQIINKPN